MTSKRSRFASKRESAFAFIIVLSLSVFAQNPTDDTRSVKSREYAERLRKRIAQKRISSSGKRRKPPVSYLPTVNGNMLISAGVDVGVTLWRLRPARKADSEALRILVRRKGRSETMVPARAESETIFAEGDFLKISIEPPFESNIYIISREQYEDGSYSEPYLIFPAKIDLDRNDKSFPGRLFFLPSDNYEDKFELTRLNPNGARKVAEILTVILSQQPIEELPLLDESDSPRLIDKRQLEHWQKEWGGRVCKFERRGGAGTSITRIEKNAGAKAGTKLTEDDPYPQTVYHIENRSKDVVVFDISLRIHK